MHKLKFKVNIKITVVVPAKILHRPVYDYSLT